MKDHYAIPCLAILALSAVACGPDGSDFGSDPLGQDKAALAIDGFFAQENWTSSGILGGTTSIASTSDPATLSLSYDVNLGNPGAGVSARYATFCTTAAASGTLSLDYKYDFYHAWFMVKARIDLIAERSDGAAAVTLVDFFSSAYTGPKSLSGSGSIDVEEGYPVCLKVGGSNFDWDSHLVGTVTLSNANISSPPADGDGDGVTDDVDQCIPTAEGEVVNDDGCSINDLAPCDGAWKNHGGYVKTVAQIAQEFENAGLISAADASAIVSAAARSSCGH